MGRTLALILKHEETRIATTFDSIGLVLCSRIIYEYQTSMTEKNLPCLNDFYSKLLDLIWPRFNVIIEVSLSALAPL